MSNQKKPYLSFLLRLWVVKNQKDHVWRCSVENVQTGERQGFASPEALCDFLSGIIMHLPEADLENNDFLA